MDVDNLSGDDFSARNDAVATGHPCVTDAVRACCAAALRNRACSDSLSQTVDERRIVGAWTSRYDALIERAKRLALAGEARGGLAFDELKRQSMALADEVFPKQQRGDVFVRVALAFDLAASGPSEKTDRAEEPEHEIAPWTKFPFLEQPIHQALTEIQRLASWNDEYKSELEQRCATFRRAHPKEQTWMEMAIRNGEIFKRVKERAYGLAFRPNGKAELEKLLSRIGMPDWAAKKMWENFAAGGKAKARVRAAKKIKRQVNAERKISPAVGKVETPFANEISPSVSLTAEGLHPNSILNLKPSKRWTIVTDETGTKFGNEAFGTGASRGRYVMVLVPEAATLPELTGKWHAVDKSLDEQMRVAEDLHKSGCGILGIPVTDLAQTNRNLWFACIEALLDIALRLLPVDTETEIELKVEQCGGKNSQNAPLLDRTLDAVMYHLSLTDPEKAKLIHLKGLFIAKDECPYNGYADLVAFSWGCDKTVGAAFGRFGWVGPCLMGDDPAVATTFRKCLTLMQQNDVLPSEDWKTLVTCRQSTSSDTLVGALLKAFGDEARQNVDLWRTYLDYTVAHLDSKAIRLSVLGKQIAWLKEYEPDAATLPPRLRLLWLTAQLAASNHTGGTRFGVAEHEREFADLTQTLKDEDAPLTCFAALHLAVEKTDRFEFEAAREMLLPWLDEPVAVPGLRYHGQILSSLGQHEAFLGNNEKALDYFDRAIAAFKRLSEHSQSEIDHTLAYAVIAAMDAKSPRLNELLATYLYGGAYAVETMVDKANQFASVGEDEPDSKYAHAIFLRHLVTLPTDDPIRAAYLAHAADWKWSTDGHPWELIAFYRAILLGPTHADYRLWLRRGYDLAKSGGPTLKLIALVIAAGLVADNGAASNAIPPAEYQSLLDKVADSLPALGESRLAALRDVNSDLMMQLSLAMRVLPFNFR